MTLRGSFIALPTPMHVNGEIDYKSLEALIAWQLEEGTDGFMVAGTTGESPTLTLEEKIKLYKFVLAVLPDSVPLIIASGTNDTASSIRLTQAAYDLGAKYSLLVCPYYNKPTQEGLFLHYEAIADAVPKMQHILYNIPGRAVVSIAEETVIRLSKKTNVIGLKDSGSSAERIRALRAACGADFSLLSSDDDFTSECLKNGGDGVISVAANIVPALVRSLVAVYFSNNMPLHEEINHRLNPLYKELFCQSNPIPLKALLHHMGKIEKGIRLPLTWLEPQYEAALMMAYQQL